MASLLIHTDRIFDRACRAWESARTQRGAATALVAIFLAALVAVALSRHGLLPAGVQAPHTYFHAVGLVFSCLLFFEALGLVFSIADSTATSVAKQLEIFSIILLRHSFQEFSELAGPLGTSPLSGLLLRVCFDAAGALLMFVLTGLYYRLQRHHPITTDAGERRAFSSSKKVVALALLGTFGALALRTLWEMAHGEPGELFGSFFTLLIFSDILLMLLSLRSSSVFRFVFRNSGFALVTVVLRLGFAAPPLYNAALGVGAALYAVGLAFAFNFFGRSGEGHESREPAPHRT